MKKKSLFFSFFLIAFHLILCAQNQQVVDSLFSQLESMPDDTNKIKTLLKFFKELNSNQPQQAQSCIEKAYSISQHIKDDYWIGKTSNSYGVMYRLTGDYSNALKMHQQAMNKFKAVNNKSGMADSYMLMGRVYGLMRDDASSLKSYLDALREYEALNDSADIVICYVNLGNLYISIDKYTEAINYINMALADAEKRDDDKMKSFLLNNLGNVSLFQKKYEKSLSYYNRALQLKEKLNDKRGVASTQLNIGTVYKEINKPEKALQYFTVALAEFEKLGAQNEISTVKVQIGAIKESQGKMEESFLNNHEAMNMALQSQNKEILMNAYKNMYMMYEKSKKLDSAIIYLNLYHEIRDSISGEKSVHQLAELQIQYETEKKDNEIVLLNKDKELQASEVKKQKLIRNSTFGGVGLIAIFSFLLVRSFNRKKKVSFEKQISDVEMKALRSQMNPHFIFNSLHSINKFMWDNDKENASEFLSKFSKLMRAVLENSREREVSLEKDLSALELYMQLESLRFQNRFQYKIEVDENIEKENTLVPPMMLQPFVENSIIHGINDKDNGMIKIKIKKENNMIHCLVEDNGIGREKAMSMSSTEKEKSKSLAMNITHERISILNQLKNTKAALNIFDLKDAENNPAGLRVELNLPLELAF